MIISVDDNGPPTNGKVFIINGYIEKTHSKW